MKLTSKELVIGLLSLYRYLMPFLMAILLFVLPSVMPRTYFRHSIFVDLVVRIVLWSYFTLGYWSLPNGLINRIRKTDAPYIKMPKTISSFISFALSGIGYCVFLWLLTWWSLSTFVPLFSKVVINTIAFGNGFVYAILVFSQYFLLPEDE